METTITAKELKNKTGYALKKVSRGDRLLVTLRGKPFAIISPVKNMDPETLRSFDEAWNDIEKTIKKSKPRYKSAKEAMRWTRKRHQSS